MKKLFYLLLVTSNMQNVLAMDCFHGGQSSPRGQNSLEVKALPEQAPVVHIESSRAPEEQGWNLFAFVPNPVAVLQRAGQMIADQMDQLDEAVGAGALKREQEASQKAVHIAVLLNELKTKTLPQAIKDAADKQDSSTFISLLIGMKAQGMEASCESKEVINQKLNYLHLARRQQTREDLERGMQDERLIHNFRSEYKKAGQELSDEESYNDLHKFADRLVNDEE